MPSKVRSYGVRTIARLSGSTFKKPTAAYAIVGDGSDLHHADVEQGNCRMTFEAPQNLSLSKTKRFVHVLFFY